MGKKGARSSEPLTPSSHTEHLRLAWLHGDTSSWFVLSTDISKCNSLRRFLGWYLEVRSEQSERGQRRPAWKGYGAGDWVLQSWEQLIQIRAHFREEDARVRRFWDCLDRETVLRENSTVPGSSEMDWWLKYAYQTIYFLLFRPCQREPWREFSVRGEGILVFFTEKSSRLNDRKNEKALKNWLSATLQTTLWRSRGFEVIYGILW